MRRWASEARQRAHLFRLALDNLTAGRLVLGLGAGWQENEHLAYGIDLLPVSHRLDRLAEACGVITGMLRGESITFSGALFQLTEALCRPLPVSCPLPLLVGAPGERRTMRIAARYADIRHAWSSSPSEFRRKNDLMDQHCGATEREPATLERATGQMVRLGPVNSPSPDEITGPIDHIVQELSAYRAEGVSEFIMRDHRDDDVHAEIDKMAAMEAEVLPAVH